MKNWVWPAAAFILLSACNFKKHVTAKAGAAEQITVTMSRNAGEGMEAKSAITDNASIDLAITPLPQPLSFNCKHKAISRPARLSVHNGFKKAQAGQSVHQPDHQPETGWMPDPFESISFEQPTALTSRVLESLSRLLSHDEF